MGSGLPGYSVLAVVLLAVGVAAGAIGGPRDHDGDDSTAERFDAGLGHYRAGNLLSARQELSSAYFDRNLPAAARRQAAQILAQIADETLFGPKVLAGDPWVRRDTVQEGETLGALLKRHDLKVPGQFILAINGLTDASQLRAGQPLKLVRGPFGAVVHKRSFAMDVYLSPGGHAKEAVLVRRFRVGLGKEDRTPAGTFLVSRKAVRPDWTPPASSALHDRGVIRYGEPDYPFGTEAYWMGLAPTGTTNARFTGLAIHSTADPGSIGKNRSLGCIRMLDKDIRALYGWLREEASPVHINDD